MVGMRDAQVEYPNPEIKKKMAAPILNCRGVLVVISSSFTYLFEGPKYKFGLNSGF